MPELVVRLGSSDIPMHYWHKACSRAAPTLAGYRYFLHSLPDAVLGPGLTDASAPNERETCPGASFKPHRAGYFGHSRPAVCLAA